MNKPYAKVHRWRGLKLRALRRLGRDGPRRYTLDAGEPFVLHRGDRLSELIYTGRGYEPVESAFCRRYLAAGDAAYDVGANIGYFTSLFSRRVGAGGVVVALEPGRHTYRLLTQTIESLGLANVVTLPVALWHRSEVLSFHGSSNGDDAQQSVARRAKHGSDVVLEPVPALSFGELVDSQWFRTQPAPALIKIDVEGAESQVIEGLAGFLDGADPPAMLIECNTEALRAAGNDPVRLLQRLQRWFELHATPLCWPPWHAERPGFEPLTELPRADAVVELNVLAVPRRGPYRERAVRALADA